MPPGRWGDSDQTFSMRFTLKSDDDAHHDEDNLLAQLELREELKLDDYHELGGQTTHRLASAFIRVGVTVGDPSLRLHTYLSELFLNQDRFVAGL
jgi:hypothetical protein